MANEDKKDFNAMLHDSKDMPKFQTITDQKSIEKYGGSKGVKAKYTPMKKVPDVAACWPHARHFFNRVIPGYHNKIEI